MKNFPTTTKVRTSLKPLPRKKARKLLKAISPCLKQYLSILDEVHVSGERKHRHSGLCHVVQDFAGRLCNNKAPYRIGKRITPKSLRKQGIEFLPKSTYYDNVPNLEIGSIKKANKLFVKKTTCFEEKPVVMQDGSHNKLKGLLYALRRKGYVGRASKAV